MPGHLIHIGFSKTGSTTLAAWFAAHPQLDFVPNGIGGYRDVAALASRAAGPADEPPLWQVTSSDELSSPRIADRPSMRGTGLPRLAVPVPESRRRVCETLRRLSPGATILIVTRGFRGALVSGYSQYVRMGGRLDIFDPMLARSHDASGFLDYDAVVRLYTEAFGADRVIVLPYELLRDEPHTFTRLLEEQLGLDAASPPLPALNRSLSPEAILWYRRLSVLVATVCRVLGPRAGERLYAAYADRIDRDRLRGPARIADRLLPGHRAEAIQIPEELLEPFRGRAAELGKLPLYAPYARDYLNTPAHIVGRG
jgi:hypothetical protein